MGPKKPNVIYILADDMGYGDIACNNPNSKIPTPNLDRMASMGLRFADAHAGSSVCTPSRYNILTGDYVWRSRLKNGIVWEWDGPVIGEDQVTVASFLKSNGYETACFGKWHLGWDWPTIDGSHPNDTLEYGSRNADKRRDFGISNIDYEKPISGGPIDKGFDSYFGVDVPNFPPYTWFEDDRLTDIPTVNKPAELYGNSGLAQPGWELENMIPEFTCRVVSFIESKESRAGTTLHKPFFLYFPLTSPHSPVVPNKSFQGLSGAGNYGDFVCEVDWVVGQVIDALGRTGLTEDTLLIFTSDNGPEGRTPDDEGVYERIQTYGHFSMGNFRGIKRDLWEAGHRVPFLACWPGVVEPGGVCDELVGLGDLLATCADILGKTLPVGVGKDSISMLPLLTGETAIKKREYAIHHSMSGKFAVRKGKWVLLNTANGGDNEEPQWFKELRGYKDNDAPGELYDLSSDILESNNLYFQHKDVSKELHDILLEALEGSGIESHFVGDVEPIA